MRKLTPFGMTLLALAAACDRTTAPTGLRPGTPQFAKPTQLSDPSVTLYIANGPAYAFRGDGLAAFVEGVTSPFAGMSRYQASECGVTGLVFALAGEPGDMIYNTAGTQDRRCSAAPRKVNLTFALINADGSLTADGSETVQSAGHLAVLDQAATSTTPGFYIAIGDSALRGLHIGDGPGDKCSPTKSDDGIAFRPVLNTGEYVGADDVYVHRDGADTWTVTSQADGVDALTGQTIHHDKGYCRGNGKMYHMPLRFSIKTSRALTP